MNTRRLIRAAAAAAVLVACLPGCSSDDNPTTPPPPEPLALAGPVGPAGGTLRSDDGRMTLTVPAGALADSVDLAITETDAADAPAAFSDFTVLKAFTVTPADIDLGPDAEWSVTVDVPAPTAKLGDVARTPLVLGATTSLSEEDVVRLPDQDLLARLPGITTATTTTPTTVNVRGLKASAVALVTVFESGSMTTRVTLGGDQDVPATGTVGTDLDAVVRLLIARDFGVVGDVTNEPGPALAGVMPGIPAGGMLTESANGTYPDDATWHDYAIAYTGSSAGSATVQQGLKFGYDFQAGFFDSYAHQPVVGSLTAHLRYESRPVELDEGGVIGHIPTGLYAVGTAAPEAIEPTVNAQWALTGRMMVAGAGGLTSYSLSSTPPLTQIPGNFAGLTSDLYGALTLKLSLGNKTAGDDSVALVAFGSGGATVNTWDPETDTWSWAQLFSQNNVTDAWPLDGDPHQGSFTYVEYGLGRAYVVNWDAGQQTWVNEGPYLSFGGNFQPPVTAFARTGGSMVIALDGDPGTLYLHDRVNPSADATAVGTLGNEPRRVRVLGEIGAVSNLGSGTLTIFTWDASDNVAVTDTVTVGDGPLDIDLAALPGGRVGIVSAGFNDDTWTLTIVDADGREVSSTSHDLPPGASAPGHAVFLGADAAQVLISCHDTGNILVADTGL